MTSSKKIKRNRGERGNALFLILIAVALFAALSYAITQSGRGGGNVSSQTNQITAGQLTEEPADVRAAVARMVLSGTAVTSIVVTNATGAAVDLFDGSVGGGATNVPPPPGACNLLADCTAGWSYVAAFAGHTSNGIFIPGVGTAAIGASTASGSDAMAALQGGTTGGTNGITPGVCAAIQKGLGFASTVPPVGLSGPVAWNATSALGYAFAGNVQTITDSATDVGTLVGQDFGCFQNTTANLFAYFGSIGDQ